MVTKYIPGTRTCTFRTILRVLVANHTLPGCAVTLSDYTVGRAKRSFSKTRLKTQGTIFQGLRMLLQHTPTTLPTSCQTTMHSTVRHVALVGSGEEAAVQDTINIHILVDKPTMYA